MVITHKRISFLGHSLSIIGFGLILTFPILINGCLDAHDFAFHFVYSKHFSEQFWQGDLYPRWLQNMNSGFGSPTFFFYAPIPYYFTSLFSTIANNPISSCTELSLSSVLALVASGLSMYFWLKEIAPRNAAAIASLIYMAWPYHLFIDLYLRYAFAEYWSFVWMPLILYFSARILTGSKRNVIGLAISLALLALTHLPTFIIFFPVPVGYALLMAGREQQKTIFVHLCIATILAVGLSAIYWLPAMTTQDSISMDAILTGKYHYANNFLFTGPKVEHDKRFWKQLELLTVLTGGLACCAWKTAEKDKSVQTQRERHYWIIVATLSLFMTLPISKFVWDVLPVVQRIQFPWRFNAVLTVAITALLALAIPHITASYVALKASSLKASNWKEYTQTLLPLAITGTAAVFALTLIYIAPTQRFVIWKSHNTILALSLITFLLVGISTLRKPINFRSHRALSAGLLLFITIALGGTFINYEIIFLKRENIHDSAMIQTSLGAPEHRPQWVSQEVFNANDLPKLSNNRPMVEVEAGTANWDIQQWQPRAIVLQVNATTESHLTIHQFYYPGWTAKITDSLQKAPARFSELGLLQILVPTGQHEIVLSLNALREERLAQIMSALSAVIVLLLYFRYA
ncbi:MAG: 6-pyruvoyl-tetrahydropterin synthase-related protein [Phormidesmis sp.]